MASTNEDELMDSVPLSENSDHKDEAPSQNDESVEPPSTEPRVESPEQAASSTTQQQEAAAPVDPWALPEDHVTTTTQSSDSSPPAEPPTDTQEALSKLKTSSVRLGQALDEKVRFSQAWAQLKTGAEKVDEQTHITDTARRATGIMGGWFQSIDESLGVTQTTQGLGQALQEHVVTPLQQQSVVQESTRRLVDLEEQHQITKSTAATLTKGAEFLTQSLVGGTRTNEASNAQDGDLTMNEQQPDADERP